MRRRIIVLLALVITLAAGFSAGYFFNGHNKVTYSIDLVNTCSWQNGHVAGSTEIGTTHGPLYVQVQKDDSRAFAELAQQKGICAYTGNSAGILHH
jgi:hypothetical protein